MKNKTLCLLLIGALCASLATGCKKNTSGEDVDPEKPSSTNIEMEHKPIEGTVAGVGGMTSFNNDLIVYLNENGYENQNYMISPTSYKAALCLAAAGANGQTQSELLSAMGFSSEEEMNIWYSMTYNETVDFMDSIENEKGTLEEINNDPEMSEMYHISGGEPDGAFKLVNSIWANSDGNPVFTEEYIDKVLENYGAPASTVPGDELAAEVNKWVSESTDGFITKLADDMSDVDLALINALYLRDGWIKSFGEGQTTKGVFTTFDGSKVQKDIMNQQEEFCYYEEEGGKLIILPMDYGVKAAFVLGTISDMDKALSEAREVEVDVKLPKMDMESTFGNEIMIGFLQSRGVDLAFDPNGAADFSVMSEIPVYISDILQKTRIKTDEKGIEAAAVTAVIMTEAMAMPPEEQEVKTFYATEPFKFFIYTELENEENEILFYGQMVE